MFVGGGVFEVISVIYSDHDENTLPDKITSSQILYNMALRRLLAKLMHKLKKRISLILLGRILR